MNKKTWTDSERQGMGRRYWFDTTEEAVKFHHRRVVSGKRNERGFVEGCTVWLTRSRDDTVDYVLAGLSPVLSSNDWPAIKLTLAYWMMQR